MGERSDKGYLRTLVVQGVWALRESKDFVLRVVTTVDSSPRSVLWRGFCPCGLKTPNYPNLQRTKIERDIEISKKISPGSRGTSEGRREVP